jgi:RNA polymerase sigma-70 factor, ECF subfamily
MDSGQDVRAFEHEGLVRGADAPIAIDAETFRALYERTAPGLRGYLRCMTRNSSLADDLLQDTFVRYLRSGVQNLTEPQMRAYLYKTAQSVLHDHYRAQTRERRGTAELAATAAGGAVDPNLGHDMNRILQNLDPRQQTLLWLAYVEGLDHREIARALDLKERSIRVVLHRARRRLADMLTRVGLGPGDGR